MTKHNGLIIFMKNKYFPVIGLEIHVELKTSSKMFCQCSADYFDKEPNSNTCPVCLGMPGALPVPNRKAVEWTIKIGQALNCKINKVTKFDRKHYFYPDLPKGYQISQYDEPIAENGFLEIAHESFDKPKKFRITRVHLEEDTGKLTHITDGSLVDFNRSSVPLVEIVTEPDFTSSEDVKIFLTELHAIIKTLDVSQADMEKGSMRMEPNISLSSIASYELRIKNLPKYKVEVKNINSFNFAKKAIDFELERQAKILDTGETPKQETRGYNEDKGITYSQRSKENAQDYRYFPEPDIPPITFSEELLMKIKSSIPKLPQEKMAEYEKKYKIKFSDAYLLSHENKLSHYFEEIINKISDKDKKVLPDDVAEDIYQHLANAIVNKKIPTDLSIEDFIKEFIKQNKKIEVDEGKLEKVIDEVIKNNAKQVEQYKAGKLGLIGFFIGQVMQGMKGQADPKDIKTKIEKIIN